MDVPSATWPPFYTFCEGYPLAETLKAFIEKKTGDTWTMFDKFLIEKISQETALSKRLRTPFGDASKAFGALVNAWRALMKFRGMVLKSVGKSYP